jgi:hypothetical protein
MLKHAPPNQFNQPKGNNMSKKLKHLQARFNELQEIRVGLRADLHTAQAELRLISITNEHKADMAKPERDFKIQIGEVIHEVTAQNCHITHHRDDKTVTAFNHAEDGAKVPVLNASVPENVLVIVTQA